MKRSQVFILFYAAAPLLLIARVLQRFYMIDPTTGFYRDGLAAAGGAITALFIAFPLVLRLLCRLCRPAERQLPDRSTTLAVGCFVGGGFLAIEAARLMLTGKGAGNILVALLSAVFAACLILRGLAQVGVLRYPAWLSLVGSAYAIVRLIVRFAGYTGEATVSDALFNILTMCLLLLFFNVEGKWQAGLGSEKNAAAFFAYGMAGALLCAAVALPGLIDLVLGGRFALYGDALPDFSYLGFAVLLPCSLLTAQKKPALDKGNEA